MYSPDTQKRIALETMIDEIGVPAVLDLLAQVCHAKADHIVASYGDDALHYQWTGHACFIEDTATDIRRESI